LIGISALSISFVYFDNKVACIADNRFKVLFL